MTETELNLILLIIGSLVLFLGAVSKLIRKWNFSQPFIALMVGFLLSSFELDIFSPGFWNHYILQEAARISIAIGVMGVALKVSYTYTFKNWRSVAPMLTIVMAFMWIINSMLIYWILGFSFIVALLVGAIMTPTDPILSASILSGRVAEKNIPEKLRNLISVESASNDGLGYPFVLLPILLITYRPQEALNYWFIHTILWEVVGAVIFGAIIGYIAGYLFKIALSKRTIDESSYVTYTLALALIVLSSIKLLGADGILAVFAAGTAFSTTSTVGQRLDEDRVVEGVDLFFTTPIFTLLGLIAPWKEWMSLGLEGLLVAFLIQLLHRIPILYLINPIVPNIRSNLDVLFAGWFGPVGVAAFYYSQFSMIQTGKEELWPIVSLVICVSIILHGITATYFTKLYGRYSRKSGNE
ncbi:MAG TPA: sodium:proton antiporter [Methanosarcina sp.]|jgi:NhaP-type Na+/H+ or K+/H+ antiporter|nr:sodium:proton antiporter [Methanosarcina sp.]